MPLLPCVKNCGVKNIFLRYFLNYNDESYVEESSDSVWTGLLAALMLPLNLGLLSIRQLLVVN